MAGLQGSLVAIVTPMLEDGTLDLEAFRRLIDWHIAEGTDGIVVVGTTGESPRWISTSTACSSRPRSSMPPDACPIIAGTGANSTSEAIELAAYAKEAGADASLSVVPYYNKPTPGRAVPPLQGHRRGGGPAAHTLQRARPHGRGHAERHRAAARADSEHRRHQGRDRQPRARLGPDPPQAARVPRLQRRRRHRAAADAGGRARRHFGHGERRAAAHARDVRGRACRRCGKGARDQQPPAAPAPQPVSRGQPDPGQMGGAADGPHRRAASGCRSRRCSPHITSRCARRCAMPAYGSK